MKPWELTPEEIEEVCEVWRSNIKSFNTNLNTQWDAILATAAQKKLIRWCLENRTRFIWQELKEWVGLK